MPRFICLTLFLLAVTIGWAVDVPYTVTSMGTVSLGMYDAQGRLVRTLLSGKKITTPGAQTVAWDGLDDSGRPVPLGSYTYKGLLANVGWQYLMAMGNAGKPPYLSADGKGGWGGAWGHVLDAAVAANGRDLYLLWAQEEGSPALLCVNPRGGTGQFINWGAHNNWSWGDCRALATDGKYVYVADNKTIDDPAGQGKKRSRGCIWRVDATNGDYANTYTGDQGLILASDTPGTEPNLVGLAADGKQLYCSLRVEQQIAILDSTTGIRVKTISAPNPAGLAMAPDGNLYALVQRQLVKYAPDGTRLGTVVADGLAEPYDLCVDGKGLIYISDHGTAMRVKVFTPAGKLVKRIGKAGGRALAGAWATLRADLTHPTGPAVTADGTLYVGEDMSPKRVCIFTGGKFTGEWLGPLASGCNNLDVADEAQPELIYHMYCPLEAVVRYRVNYQQGTHAVDCVWELAHTSSPCPVYDLSGGGGGCVRHFQGKTFLYRYDMPLSIFRIDGAKLIPASRIDMSINGPLATESLAWASRPGKPILLPSGFRLLPQTVHDTNGNGNIEEAEVDWSLPADLKPDMRAVTWYQPYVAQDLTIYAWGWQLPCLGLDAQGNPIYSWSKAERLPTRPMGKLADPTLPTYLNTSATKIGSEEDGDLYPGGREISIWVDPDDGGYFFTADVEGKGKGIGWASNGILARIGKMGKDGRWIWQAGDKATGFVKPGQFYKPGSYTGIANGCLGLTDWNGQMRLFDKNTGLYVASLFSDGYKGSVPDENLISVEFTEGHLFTHPKTGQAYALAGDAEGQKLYKVTGLDTIQRFQGAVSLTAQTSAAPSEEPEPPAVGWSVAELSGVQAVNLSQVFFLDATHGWICHAGGTGGGPLYTVDGGKTWKGSSFVANQETVPEGETPLLSSFEKFEQHGLWFIDARSGWLGGTRSDDGFLAKTTDGGVTWTPLPLPKHVTVKTLWFANAQQGWMAPFWGEPVLRRTDDGGATWRVIDLKPVLTGQVANPSNWPHRDFYAFDMQHLVVVGAEGIVLRTADGGETWQVSHAMPADGAQELLAVSFTDAAHGLAVGVNGITAVTHDGGVTWTATASGVPNTLTSVAMTSPSEGWATGMTIYKGSSSFATPGCILSTTDGGKSWKNVSPATTGLRNLHFIDARHGWAVGGSGGSANEPARMLLQYVR